MAEKNQYWNQLISKGLGDFSSLWNRDLHEWMPTERVKYGKNYYWAVTDGLDSGNGSGYSVYKIDYYYSTSKTGAGTKLFSSYETRGGDNDMIQFFTNGTYIIKTESNTSNPNIKVCRYDMKGKNRKTLRTFKAGSSSDEGKGYSSYCDVSILRIYGGNVYAAYHQSGSGMQAKIIRFPVKGKKAAKTVKTTYCYFAPDTGKYIGFIGDEGTSIYNMATGKSKKLTSSRITYLGKYKNKLYYSAAGTNKTVIYSVNTAWKKRAKVYTINSQVTPFMKGKNIYYYTFSTTDYKQHDYQYDIAKKTKTELTPEEYSSQSNEYYNKKRIKDLYIYWK
jgi:hypothetical protein